MMILPAASTQRWAASLAAAALVAFAPARAASQQAASASGQQLDALASWIALRAQPAHERAAMDAIAHTLPGWHRDALGDLVLRRGSGRPRRVVACALDEAGYAVSEITPDGYLRIHDAGFERRSPLWDQFHEGQRILVLTPRGPVAGVASVRSVHLWRRRATPEAPVTVDELWIDVGARSRAEAERWGIELLDPVIRNWPRWVYGDRVAGPGAADRAGCAAVAAASRRTPAHGETVFVIATQTTFAFGWDGLSAAIAPLGTVDTLVIASARLEPRDSSATEGAVSERTVRPPFPPVAGLTLGPTIALAVHASFGGSLVESVTASDVAAYLDAVARAAGVATTPALSVATLPAPPEPRPLAARADAVDSAGSILSALTETYAVSGHEAAMREAVVARLPAWARARVVTDTAGDLVLALGPDRDTSVIVAHLDEVGFEVSAIASDGVVSLRRRGGFFESLWEGQTALAHIDRDGHRTMLRGVFVPRARAPTRQPTALTAYFGMDSAALVASGVTVGTAVTSLKTAARLGPTRFTARAIDDRAGCTALILAARAIDPARLTHKVIFAWSVREEVSLGGASAMANTWRSSVKKVYAVDTFVSSDSPLESAAFALAPLGDGAVLRGLDNSSATPPRDIAQVEAVAHAARIPLQMGTTNGGNDGSEFTRYGTVDIPLAWPLRYSHSPAELIDLRDEVSLARLIVAIANEGAGSRSKGSVTRDREAAVGHTPAP